LQCDVSGLPKFSFFFFLMFTVSRNLHFHATFQFSKYICESQISHTFLNLLTFHTFLISHTFVFSNTGKSSYIFENIKNNLNFLHF
jgi:hypothetical protein